MNINISSSSINIESTNLNEVKKILLAGEASSSLKAREIFLLSNKEEALSLFGPSELYNAFCLLIDSGVKEVYTCNCFAESDYLRLTDKILHYDFDYFIPIGIYLSDTFYNPITDKNQYYTAYFLEQLYSVKSLTTIIITEKHASLYEDFDHYMTSMSNIESDFLLINDNSDSSFFEECGNNLNFVYNNLKNIPYSNVVIGALYYNRDYAKYLYDLNDVSVVFDINNIDMLGLKAMYFKYNFYSNKVTIENCFNFKKTQDIYSNALIDDVIKRTIRSINLDKFKGTLYNPYVYIQIQNEATKKLKLLKRKLFKDFEINKITFKKTSVSSGYIIFDYSIKPYGTLESVNIIMGV